MSLRKEITEFYRNAIVGGALRPGDALPTTAEIAARYGTRNANVQRALTELVCEGLIRREPRIGTFVLDRPTELRTAALYLERLFQGLESPYRRYLLEALENGLNRRGLHCRVVVGNASDPGVRQLQRLIGLGRIQAVLLVDVRAEIIEELKKLPVPVLGVTPNPGIRRVVMALGRSFPALAREFAVRGCRRVGVIGLRSRQMNFSGSAVDEEGDFGLATLAAAFAKTGVAVDDRAIPLSRPEAHAGGSDAVDGARQLRALIEEPEPPDGLLILSDSMTPGVVAAAAEIGIRFDRQFKLTAIQRNRQIPPVFPGPALFVEFDLDAIAETLLNMLQNPGGIRRFPVYPELHYQERLA